MGLDAGDYNPVGSRTDQRLLKLERASEDTANRFSELKEGNIRDIVEIKQGIVYIKGAVDDLKTCQDSLNVCVNTMNVEMAKMPSLKVLNDTIDAVKTHKTYFALIGVSLLVIVGWLSNLNPFR